MLKKYFTKLYFCQHFFKSDRALKDDKRLGNLNTVFLQLSPFFPDGSNDYDESTIDLLTKRENLEREKV